MQVMKGQWQFHYGTIVHWDAALQRYCVRVEKCPRDDVPIGMYRKLCRQVTFVNMSRPCMHMLTKTDRSADKVAMPN